MRPSSFLGIRGLETQSSSTKGREDVGEKGSTSQLVTSECQPLPMSHTTEKDQYEFLISTGRSLPLS